jgi:hypothetical protein
MAGWRDGLTINLISNGIGVVVGAIVAYLKHEGSIWVSPLLFGMVAWFLTMGIWVVARVFRNVPRRQIRITEDNIQSMLRGWLDDLGLKVQSLNETGSYFKFIVTTDGGKVITISRDKDYWPEYLTYRALYKEGEENKVFASFSPEEKAEARLAIQLELARAVIGYNAPDVLEDFTLFKRIPISPSLGVEDVSKTLWEVEAALSSVFFVGARLKVQQRMRAGELTSESAP